MLNKRCFALFLLCSWIQFSSLQGQDCTCILVDMMVDVLVFFGMIDVLVFFGKIDLASSRYATLLFFGWSAVVVQKYHSAMSGMILISNSGRIAPVPWRVMSCC